MTSRAVIIHSLEHARAALAAAERLDRPITLYSAEGAGSYGGAAWFQAIVAAAQASHPGARCEAVLDCGDSVGLALAALREGCRAIVVRGAPSVRRKIAAIAEVSAARLAADADGALDLHDSKDPESAVAAWLSH
jgi:fructose/tagatose bisphosphate aldolase